MAFLDRGDQIEVRRIALIARHLQHKVEAAYRRAHRLHRWRMECDRRRGEGMTEADLADRIMIEARQTEGANFAISFRSLQLWRRDCDARGEDGRMLGVEALIDRRGTDGAGGGTNEGRSPEAVEYF
ncbi:MAG: hypothetical protein Q7R41_16355, partial [Phycisphaerales bacterium]|nr:hypothetical protein [Phycisphaerales bacterium]